MKDISEPLTEQKHRWTSHWTKISLNPSLNKDISEPLTEPKISLNPSQNQRYLWTPSEPKISLNPSQNQRYLWTPHRTKDISEPLTEPKISLNPSQNQRYLWTPHRTKDISEPLTEPKISLNPSLNKDISEPPVNDLAESFTEQRSCWTLLSVRLRLTTTCLHWTKRPLLRWNSITTIVLTHRPVHVGSYRVQKTCISTILTAVFLIRPVWTVDLPITFEEETEARVIIPTFEMCPVVTECTIYLEPTNAAIIVSLLNGKTLSLRKYRKCIKRQNVLCSREFIFPLQNDQN